jgi:hypothetical protein
MTDNIALVERLLLQIRCGKYVHCRKNPAADKNSMPVITYTDITRMCFEQHQMLSKHTPYSPDLAPSDYHMFPGLKKLLKCRHFPSNVEVVAAA